MVSMVDLWWFYVGLELNAKCSKYLYLLKKVGNFYILIFLHSLTECFILIWTYCLDYILGPGLGHVYNFIGYYTGDADGYFVIDPWGFYYIWYDIGYLGISRFHFNWFFFLEDGNYILTIEYFWTDMNNYFNNIIDVTADTPPAGLSNLNLFLVGVTFSVTLILVVVFALDPSNGLGVDSLSILLPLAVSEPWKTLNDGNFSKKLNLLKFYHKISKTSPNSDLKFYNIEGKVIEKPCMRFEFKFKDACYRLIALFVFIVLISAAVLFLFDIFDLILFIFLILISNFVIIKEKSREWLKLLLPLRKVCLSFAGVFTDVELFDSSSEICDNRTTVSGDESENENVKPLTDHTDLKKYDDDDTTNSIVMRRSGEIISDDQPEKGETPSSSEFISSKYDIRKPLETIEEVSEEDYDDEVDYDGDSEGNDEPDSDLAQDSESVEMSRFNSSYKPPSPLSESATTPASAESSSDIEIEGPFYSSDEEQAPKPPSVDK